MTTSEDLTAPALASARRAADRRMLHDLATGSGVGRRAPSRRRRSLVVALPLIAVAAAASTAAAAAFLPAEHATVHDTVRCYGTVSNDGGRGFPGSEVGIAVAPGKRPADVPAVAVSSCAALWRAGLLSSTGVVRPRSDGAPPAAPATVPALTACVLRTGQAAVYPAAEQVCEQLGLPPLAP